MERHALLIGYSGKTSSVNATLGGVLQDLKNYRKYLTSLTGGAWFDTEIEIMEDFSLNAILNKLSNIRGKYDLVFTVYSGHGEYDDTKQCRILGTADGKEFTENDFENLAKWQISIFDSCSGIRIISEENESSEKKMLLENESFKTARTKYEKLCSLSPEQELRYYASSKGSNAYDDVEGGIYSTTLLKTLKNATDKIDIDVAHEITKILVQTKTHSKQKPDKFVPKISKYLPGAIGNNYHL